MPPLPSYATAKVKGCATCTETSERVIIRSTLLRGKKFSHVVTKTKNLLTVVAQRSAGPTEPSQSNAAFQ
eukprot:11978623-Karenia_brevis.AAC.1